MCKSENVKMCKFANRKMCKCANQHLCTVGMWRADCRWWGQRQWPGGRKQNYYRRWSFKFWCWSSLWWCWWTFLLKIRFVYSYNSKEGKAPLWARYVTNQCYSLCPGSHFSIFHSNKEVTTQCNNYRTHVPRRPYKLDPAPNSVWEVPLSGFGKDLLKTNIGFS